MSKFALRALLANWEEATPAERRALERKVPGAFGQLQPVLKQLAAELQRQVRHRTHTETAAAAAANAASNEVEPPHTPRKGGAVTVARSAPVSPQKPSSPGRPSRNKATSRSVKPKRRARTPETPVPIMSYAPQNTPRVQQHPAIFELGLEPWSTPPSPILLPSDLPTLEAYTGRWLDPEDDSLLVPYEAYDAEPLRCPEDELETGDSPEAQAIGIIAELVQLRQQIDSAYLRLDAAPQETNVQAALRDLAVARECGVVAETAAHRLFSSLLAGVRSPQTETLSSCGPSDCSLSDLDVSANTSEMQLAVVTPQRAIFPAAALSRPVPPVAHGGGFALADLSLYYSSSRWSASCPSS